MWAHKLIAPGRLEAVEVEEPGEPRPGRRGGAVRGGRHLRQRPAELPRCADLLVGASHGKPGYPLHEVVGEVEASAADDLPVGTRVVGWPEGHLGLAEKFVARAD